MKVILCLGSHYGKVMNNELGKKTRALGSKTFCNNSDTRIYEVCFSVVKRNSVPVYFHENAGRFDEWLNMKEKKSKVTNTVFESWDQENYGSIQKLGSWEEKFILIVWLEACLF